MQPLDWEWVSCGSPDVSYYNSHHPLPMVMLAESDGIMYGGPQIPHSQSRSQEGIGGLPNSSTEKKEISQLCPNSRIDQGKDFTVCSLAREQCCGGLLLRQRVLGL